MNQLALLVAQVSSACCVENGGNSSSCGCTKIGCIEKTLKTLKRKKNRKKKNKQTNKLAHLPFRGLPPRLIRWKSGHTFDKLQFGKSHKELDYNDLLFCIVMHKGTHTRAQHPTPPPKKKPRLPCVHPRATAVGKDALPLAVTLTLSEKNPASSSMQGIRKFISCNEI